MNKRTKCEFNVAKPIDQFAPYEQAILHQFFAKLELNCTKLNKNGEKDEVNGKMNTKFAELKEFFEANFVIGKTQNVVSKHKKLDLKLELINAAHKGENGNEFTFLMYAVAKNNLDLTKYLLPRGCFSNTINSMKQSALHFAAMYATNAKIGKKLLDTGANINLENGFRQKPLDVAKYYKNDKMVALLLKEGATCRDSFNREVNKEPIMPKKKIHGKKFGYERSHF